MKIVRLQLMILFLFTILEPRAQTMFVNAKLGARSVYSLNDVEKIIFETGDKSSMKVKNRSGALDSFALTNIKHLTFDDLVTSIEDAPPTVKQGKISVFPNPTKDVLYIITDKKEARTIKIISVQGSVMYSSFSSGDTYRTRINLADLPRGLYLCRITGERSNQTIKLIIGGN